MFGEANAQTAEIIDAGTKSAAWYTGQAGVAAGTIMIMLIVAIALLIMQQRRMEKRDQEIAELKVQCAKEILQAKIDAEKEADEKVKFAWQRVGEIYGSVNSLFTKCDASNADVAKAVGKLTTILATKGIFAND